MRISKLHVLSAAAIFSLAGSAFAAHPLVTDDTGTQSTGNQLLEFNTDNARTAGVTQRVAGYTYTYGVASNLDVYAGGQGSLTSPKGLGDVAVGAKYRFLESGDSSLAIKPEIVIPTANEDKGLGTGRTNLGVTLVASHASGPWAFNANLGVSTNRFKDAAIEDASNSLIWRTSASALYKLTEKATLAFDFGIARNVDKAVSTKPAYGLVGIIYSPTPNIDVDLGTKFGLNDASVDRQIGGGVAIHF